MKIPTNTNEISLVLYIVPSNFHKSHLKSTMNLKFRTLQHQLLYMAMQYTEQTVNPPHRPIFTCIKLNGVRWPDSDSVRTQRKSCAMKTSPKKAESAPVLLILEQLWAGRMWKGQKGSRILHMNLRTRWAPDCKTVCDYKLRYHAPPAAEQTHGCRVRCAAVPAGEDAGLTLSRKIS